MSRPRRFSKAEIMDAARAAAETGLDVRLTPQGEIVFEHHRQRRKEDPTPEELLAGWLQSRQSK
jgi:hypothetical protein